MSPLPPVFHCSTAPYAGTRACCRRYGGAKTFIDTEKSHSSVTIQLRVARLNAATPQSYVVALASCIALLA